jgi:hypothetical protein
MSTPDYSSYVDDAPDEEKLKTLSRLAQQQHEAEQAVEKANEALSKAQDVLRDLQERQIPSLMDEIGIAQFTTTTGLNIAISEKLRISVPKANKKAAMEWIEEHGGEALIKRLFTIQFGKGDEKWARKFQRDLNQRKKKVNCVITVDCPAATTKKFITDQLESGTEVPLQLFGGYHQRQSKIEVKKV